MTRTARYKATYFAMLGGGVLLAVALIAYFRWPPVALLALAAVMLVPGRVLGFFWRDLLRGLRLLNAGDYAASKACSERFLADTARRPWIRHLIWLGGGSYSRDPQAMALNNLGAAEFKLGEFDAARRHLGQSIEADPRNPLPFYNLARLAVAEDDMAEAERCQAEAVRLGFTGGITDKIVRSSQNRFARIDGQGR